MSKLNPHAALEMLKMLNTSGIDTPEARAVAQELSKVALTPGAIATPIDRGMIAMVGASLGQRFKDAARYVLTGVTPGTWFSPAQPLAPAAGKEGDGSAGRRFDFPVGMNINYQPRSEGRPGGVPFNVLRNLGDAHDLLRLVIETRKDQISSFEWEIAPKDDKQDASKFNDQIKRATEFFERPTPEHDWLEWLRALVEDDLVCGSIALYPRMNRGGQLHSLMPVDVATIKKLVDEHGYQPLPPDPAYQQVMKGIAAVDYTSDDLVYWIRNPRTWKLYGYGPVEQVLVTVNIALRRQQFQMEYYTDGNIPDMILGVPDTWTPDQIKEFQTWWDSILSGNTAVRRKVRFMPEVKNQIMPKDASVVLIDSADEWFARIICFAFSIAPTALIKMTNRAQSEQVAETAKEEGLMPFLNWLNRKLTWVINTHLQCPDVKFAFKLSQEVDPKVKADTNSVYVKNGIMLINEAREDIGRGPIPGGEKAVIITATGAAPLKESLDRAVKDLENPPAPPPVAPAPGSTPQGGGKPVVEELAKPAEKPAAAEKIELHVHQAPVTVTSPEVRVNLPAIKVDAPKLGDTHVHVSPPGAPDVFVEVGATTLHADMRSEGGGSVEKTIIAKRDSEGNLVGTVTVKKAA